MNFLAHSYLSFQQPGLIVGNYLGDFLRNPQVELLPAPVRKGVDVHRMIDSYTDTHKIVKSATRLLHPTMGKYSPVVIDIYFDYLLSKRWMDFSKDRLEVHCKEAYRILLEHDYLMSDRIASRMRRMVADRWLENYQTYEGLQRIFNFLSKRAKFTSNLDEAPAVLQSLESELEAIFVTFFPEIIIEVKNYINKIAMRKEG